MIDRAYIISRTLENKIAIAENNDQNTLLVTLDVLKEILALLKEHEEVEGHWIPIESPTGVEAFGIKEMTVQVVRCSVCDAEEDVSFAAYRFCPRCGAKMEGW